MLRMYCLSSYDYLIRSYLSPTDKPLDGNVTVQQLECMVVTAHVFLVATCAHQELKKTKTSKLSTTVLVKAENMSLSMSSP